MMKIRTLGMEAIHPISTGDFGFVSFFFRLFRFVVAAAVIIISRGTVGNGGGGV